MKKILLIISMCAFCLSCGVKSEPEYKSQNNYKKIIHLI